MAASQALEATPSVIAAAVVMGTQVNLDLLERRGFSLPQPRPGPNDLVLALRASTEHELALALALTEERLSPTYVGGESPARQPRTIRAAARYRPTLSLALVSTPGATASYEIAEALACGLDVVCFSGGVSLADEALLKRRALASGLLLLGPECGTVIIDGVGIGFANVVASGPIGIVGASGTGIQEVACLLDQAGVGISHAIGVGGRDLSSEVGGAMTLRALELLAEDAATEVIVILSKPPSPRVATRVRRAAGTIDKPVVTAFLGPDATLEQAAERAARYVGVAPRIPLDVNPRATPGALRGLFSGGTLCTEAMLVASQVLGPIYSNIPLEPEWALTDVNASHGHTFVDFGQEELTDRRAHPMLDLSLRLERIEREASDPDVGVILLDVVLGRGAHRNPAEELAPIIAACLERRVADLTIVAALCGAAADPQGLDAQAAALESAGAFVARGTAHATRIALRAVGA